MKRQFSRLANWDFVTCLKYGCCCCNKVVVALFIVKKTTLSEGIKALNEKTVFLGDKVGFCDVLEMRLLLL